MQIKTQTKEFKFFKWVVFSVVTIKSKKEIENTPVYILDKEYYKREFLN